MSPRTARGDAVVSVIQGQHKICSRPETILTTILGSCVAACLYDPQARIGGMNHFLLPGHAGSDARDIRFGANAMELLINDLLKRGAERSRLHAKLFGGATLANTRHCIGKSNAEVARRFLDNEGIRIAGASLGGTMARRVRFWPGTGRAQQQLVPNSQELTPLAPVPPAQTPPSVTLF